MGEHESCAIPSMSVRELLTDQEAEFLDLDLISDTEGLDNTINQNRIQRPGLALAGFLEYIHPGRIQVLGKAEITYLSERSSAERSRIISQLCRQGVSCFVVTGGQQSPDQLLEQANNNKVPLFTTTRASAEVIDGLARYLQDRLAPRAVMLGVLFDIYGLGSSYSETAV